MDISSIESNRPVALVTGAARRLGREIALELARQGHDIAVHYATSRDDALATVAELQALGVRAEAFNRDLSVEAGVESLVPQVVQAFGRLDVLVNNASLFEYDDVHTLSHESLERHLRPNLAAPILLARGLARYVADAEQSAAAAGETWGVGPRAVVINLLDQKLYNYNPDFLSYTFSKAALQAATTMLAQALAPRIRVVGVAPGLTMISHLQTEEQFTATHKLSPLGRSSQPEDVARAVAFAASNRSITGSTILVDAGQHLIHFERDFSCMGGDAAPSAVPNTVHGARPDTGEPSVKTDPSKLDTDQPLAKSDPSNSELSS